MCRQSEIYQNWLHILLKHDIFRLDISVHDIKLGQMFQSFDKTLHNDSDLLQVETSLTNIDQLVKVSIIEELKDNIQWVLWLKNAF